MADCPAAGSQPLGIALLDQTNARYGLKFSKGTGTGLNQKEKFLNLRASTLQSGIKSAFVHFSIRRLSQWLRHAAAKRWLISAACTALAVTFVVLVNSCSTVQRAVVAPPEIPGAHFVGNQACVDCHKNQTRIFPASPHARLHIEGAMKGESGCEACHGPGSKHIEVGGGRRFIFNPGRDPASCFRCHLEQHAEFSLPQHHPVLEGRMNCAQCHDPHGADIRKHAGGLAMARLNQSCAECHREQARPYVFEHEALREGCTVCHSPHGSVNAKMLIERDNNLCLKCHAQVQGTPGSIYIGSVDHTTLIRQGGCWSAGCHTAVHGSNFHPKQLY